MLILYLKEVLLQFYIVSYYKKWVKSLWAESIVMPIINLYLSAAAESPADEAGQLVVACILAHQGSASVSLGTKQGKAFIYRIILTTVHNTNNRV